MGKEDRKRKRGMADSGGEKRIKIYASGRERERERERAVGVGHLV
jgi:hypothetical protein